LRRLRRNLGRDQPQSRLRPEFGLFQLRVGSHRNKAMQAAWATHSEAGFAYAVAEVLEVKDVSPYILDRLLKERLAHWQKELGAGSVVL